MSCNLVGWGGGWGGGLGLTTTQFLCFLAMTLFFLPAGGGAQASPNTFMPAQPESQKDNYNASKTEGKALKLLVCFSSVIDRDFCSLPL